MTNESIPKLMKKEII